MVAFSLGWIAQALRGRRPHCARFLLDLEPGGIVTPSAAVGSEAQHVSLTETDCHGGRHIKFKHAIESSLHGILDKLSKFRADLYPWLIGNCRWVGHIRQNCLEVSSYGMFECGPIAPLRLLLCIGRLAPVWQR